MRFAAQRVEHTDVRAHPGATRDSERNRSPYIARIRRLLAGPVAQRLVQGTHNPLVAGSNPAGPTTLCQERHPATNRNANNHADVVCASRELVSSDSRSERNRDPWKTKPFVALIE